MVRAIDMQQVITQSYPVEKVQQTQQQHPDIQQRYFDLKLNEEQRLLREKVTHMEQSDRPKVSEREAFGKPRQEARKDREPEEQGPPQEPSAADLSQEGSLIDIKV